MKILFLTPQLPYPPRQGTQLRNFHLLRAAASEHQVDLISFAREGELLGPDSPLRALCGCMRLLPAPHRTRWDRLRALLGTRDPDMAWRLPSQGFAATLRSVLSQNEYDVIQVAGIEMARYISLARAVSPEFALVFDDHNVENLLQARAAAIDTRRPAAWPRALYSLVQWLRLRRYEAEVCRSADAVLAVSEPDAAALRRLVDEHGEIGPRRSAKCEVRGARGEVRGAGGCVKVHVVPNGVDTDYFLPDPSARYDPAALLFTGTMDYRPNVDAIQWFAASVLPRVAARRRDVRLYVVGRSPAPSLVRLANRDHRVVVTGPVEDVRPHFARVALFVAPIRMAGGSRLKIMEALAMGLPVVSTVVGAEGIDLAEGEEALLADTPERFAAAVLRLLEDPSLRARLATAGRRAAEERFDWRHVGPRLLGVYAGLGGTQRNSGELKGIRGD